MKVELDAHDLMRSISEEINRIPNLTAEAEKRGMRKIGKILQAKVKAYMPTESKDYGHRTNYDGSTLVHMKDDVKFKVKDEKGYASLVVYGDKYTGYKWHLLDDGTRDPNGDVHTEATHFTSKALKAAEPEIDAIISEMIEEVSHDRG